ncbi:MAG TPA: glycosyltransferase family 4 protein [Tepidisphaeraceae bacterium]|jgi:glycosyltransferase involved in cell wall biosynthesis|nr:glycosyltransferase family 4 protein [Tepidisphaeraceae bacterium]
MKKYERQARFSVLRSSDIFRIMSLVFINSMTDTFTPTNSFSTATWVWELCQCAMREGTEPWVISSDSFQSSYDWKKLILISQPYKPASWLGRKLDNQFRHRFGWVHPGQAAWIARVIRSIKYHKLEHHPLILSNDIELAIMLRKSFPDARIIHHAHNENGTKERFRSLFKPAVTVASAVSDCTRVWNEQYYGFARGEMETILNGVDLGRFFPAEKTAEAVPIVNFHSRLDRNKGVDVLLRAAIKTARVNHVFAVKLVGRKFNWQAPADDYDREVESLCEQLQRLGVRMERTGWIDRGGLPEVLRQAQVNVVSSRWAEPSALALYEGLATGLATVASNVGGNAQVIGDGGQLFDNENTDQLAAILLHLIGDPSVRAEWGKRARERAERLTWAQTWRRFRELAGVEANEPAVCQ